MQIKLNSSTLTRGDNLYLRWPHPSLFGSFFFVFREFSSTLTMLEI